MKDDCIFCKLANGVFETNTLYEDDKFRVIFDAAPATKGHVLVIPKEHYANIFEIPEELIADAYKVAKKVATALKEVTGCDGINILQNNGEVAGQTVFHLHIHIIPRYEKGEMVQWNPGEMDESAVKEIIEKTSNLL
ncbi:MAG: HIT family protein [Eubacterium sp.]|nr:HIT family protein [Eubacterium sp.]